MHEQNTKIRLLNELTRCSYNQNMKDFIANMVIQIMKFPKRHGQAKYVIRNMNQDNIIVVYFPMDVLFSNKNYNVPLQIYIMKNIPYEAPQIFIDVNQNMGINTKNTDIEPSTKRVLTPSLRAWSQYNTIDKVLNEIYISFSRSFPVFKLKPGQQQPMYNPPPPPPQQSGGNIYDLLNNEAKSAYNQFANNPNYPQSPYGNYQPPQNSFYGQKMGPPMNNEPPRGFGSGGIYDNNKNNNYMQGNNQYNQPPPNNNMYNNNNNNNLNTFDNPFNNSNSNPFANQYNNNNNNYGNQYNNNYGNNNMYQPNYNNQNPNEDFRNTLLNEVCTKINNKIKDENRNLNFQLERIKQLKAQISEDNERIKKLSNNTQLKNQLDEDLNKINQKISSLKTELESNKGLTDDNCVNYLNIQDSNCIKMISKEISTEEMILIVRKAFEKKKISFSDAVFFTRKATRDLFAIKFLKNKALKNYNY